LASYVFERFHLYRARRSGISDDDVDDLPLNDSTQLGPARY
jgi:hypothetical protein